VLGLVIGLTAVMLIGALVGGWYAADWWLQHFACRVAQSLSGFVLCVVLAVASLLVVILLQMHGVRCSNPVEFLQHNLLFDIQAPLLKSAKK
jgi:hypothetical protein